MKRIQALLAALLLLAASVQAARLDGVVLDAESMDGVAGALVVARPANDAGDPIFSTLSADDGTYTLDGLEAGLNLLTAIHPGYDVFEALVELSATDSTFFEIVLQPAGISDTSLEGYVQDALSGQPLDGVMAQLVQDDMAYTTFSEGGQFIFDGLAAGPVQLSLQLNGYLPSEQSLVLQSGANQVSYGLVPLNSDVAATLELFVSSPDGPVAGALAQVVQPPFITQSQLTDDSGYALLEGLTEGPAELLVISNGHLPFQLQTELLPGANLLDVTLEPMDTGELALISGFVRDAATTQPLPGVQVSVTRGDQLLLQTETDEEGLFASGDSLQSGFVVIQLEREGYLPISQSLYLAGGMNQLEYAMLSDQDPEPASLAGQVLNIYTGEGVADAFVFLMGDTGEVFEAQTGPNGGFELTGLQSGFAGLLQIDHPGYHPFVDELVLEPGVNSRVYQLEPNNQQGLPANLSGVLLDAITGDPVADASVLFMQDGELELTQITGEDGAFAFNDLAIHSGVATFFVSHADYFFWASDLYLTPGDNQLDVELFPNDHQQPVMTVHGLVMDEITRLPLPDVEITFEPTSGIGETQVIASDDMGYFGIDLAHHNTPYWLVRASLPGYVDYEMSLAGLNIPELWLEILMLPEDANQQWAWLQGSVTQDNDQPVEWADLEAVSLSEDSPLSYYAPLNPDGSFDLQVPPGEYVLSCHALVWIDDVLQPIQLFYPNSINMEDAEPLAVAAGQTLEGLDFVLPTSDGGTFGVDVSGVVRDESGQPLPGATVRFWTANEELADAMVVTDEDGAFSTTVVMDRLPIVPFTLSAEHQAYELQFFTGAPSFNTATRFLFTSNGEVSNADFQLHGVEAGESLHGYVIPHGEHPGRSLVAAFSPEGDYVKTVVSDEEGFFHFTGLEEDRQLALLFYSPGHTPKFAGGAMNLGDAQLVTPGHLDPINMDLLPVSQPVGPNTIGGMVFSESRVALPGALVMAYTPSTGDVRFAFTSSSGWFQMEGLGNDVDVELHVSAPGYESGHILVHTHSGMQQTQMMEIGLNPLDSTDLGEGVALPTEFRVLPNHPNPFNPVTILGFEVPRAQRLQVAVYNLRGALVAQLADQVFSAGSHRITFDGSRLSSGQYFLRIRGEGVDISRPMLLVK